MYFPDRKDFIKLARQGSIIPVYREILADLETPVSAFRKITKENTYSFLLESVEGGEILGRYSFLGVDPYLTFQSTGREYRISSSECEKRGLTDDPLDELKSIMRPFRSVDVEGLPRFTGGAVGYVSYPVVRFWEKIPKINPDDLNIPDSFFFLTDTVVIFDHVQHKMKVVCNAFIDDTDREKEKTIYENSVEKIERIVEKLREPSPLLTVKEKRESPTEWASNFEYNDFIRSVDKAKDYIKAGDIFQVVLSQRWKRQTSSEPIDIYRALRSLNPSPYMYYLNFGTFKIIGSSPEILVRKEREKIILRPIAGTRHRGKDEEEDRKLMEGLLQDPKERAEHIMLVDLGRNDVGRVSIRGSVTVTEFMCIEKYSHVMHIVSNVEGTIEEGNNEYDVLRVCFPAGTVTGAPK
ncbi:MAG TPA: anthranilate synthase component I, partial [Candidatus Omnitrophica bacterium]|nr:anthranilate synthase component I [Candidatus Omnitrophota bacterium]